MSQNRRPWQALLGAAIIALVGAWPAFVDAHAVFVGAPAAVPAGSDVALAMNVPHERDDTTYNVGIAIRLPDGWTGVSCQNKPTWTCSIGLESGRVVVRFDKDPQAGPAEDETFGMTLHAGPTPGAASFPTLQTYNTGETVAWIGDPSSAEPAPSLQVSGAAPAVTTTVAVTPTTPPANPPTTVAQPVPTTAQTTTTTSPPPTTLAAVDRSSTTSSSSTTSTTAEPTSSTTARTTTTDPIETAIRADSTVSISTVADAGDGGSVAGIVIGVLAVLAAGGGVFAYLRHRRTESLQP